MQKTLVTNYPLQALRLGARPMSDYAIVRYARQGRYGPQVQKAFTPTKPKTQNQVERDRYV